MKRIMRRRPSPAMAVALVALFVALGGTASAVVAISGSSIQTRSIPGDRVERNALTGTEIRESSLGKVPRARRANTAGFADVAGKAGDATNATNARNAANATNATHADTAGFASNGVLAYAHVLANGDSNPPTLDPARTRGFSAVRKVVDDNHYCLTPSGGADERKQPADATLDFDSTSIDQYARTSVGAPDCNPGEFEVLTPGDQTAGTVNFNVIVG